MQFLNLYLKRPIGKTLKPQFAFITRRYKFLLSNLIAFFYLFAFFIPTMFETANDH